MSDSENSYYNHLRSLILANKEFKTTDASEFICQLNAPFDREEYSKLLTLLKSKDWQKITQFQTDYDYVDEFLIVESFKDQNGKMFAVTIYDSNFLEHDPEIIDLFPLTSE